MDATLVEEQLREAEMVISINRHGEVCQLAKLGGAPMDALTLLNCTTSALLTAREITDLISTRLDEDARAKDVGGLLDTLAH